MQVLAYAVEHSKDIEFDMNTASAIHKAERKAQKAVGIAHRRKELSKAPHAKCSVYQVETTVIFNCLSYDK